jgi:replicative DNA helicase
MNHLINKIESIIKNQHADQKEIVYQLKQLLYETDMDVSAAKESKNINELVSESLNKLNSAIPLNIIKSGFDDLDNTFGSFHPGEFVIIGGRPGMGKTQLLVNLALNMSIENPVLYFTFDLSDYTLTNRFISSLTGISSSRILNQALSDEDKVKLVSVNSVLTQHKLYVNESCRNSISSFKTHCQKMIEENGIKVIIVDYLQMMSSTKYRNNRELEISYISRELKNIAKEFNVCVIATSQLSRAVESRGGSKYPQLSDLRDSGSIEQDADKVIFIFRPEYYGIELDEEGNNTSGLIELVLAKNRNGKLGTVKLMRDTEFTNFKNFENSKTSFSFSTSRLNEFIINKNNTNSTTDTDNSDPF